MTCCWGVSSASHPSIASVDGRETVVDRRRVNYNCIETGDSLERTISMRFTSADTEATVTSSPLSVKTSSVCTVVGSACLWAWGFMAALSPNLFPETWFETGSNVEYSFYASQAVLVVLALIAVTCFRRKVPTLPRGMVAAAALLLMLASYTVSLVTRLADPPDAAFIACGIAYGVGDMLLTIAWGTRYSLGSPHDAVTSCGPAYSMQVTFLSECSGRLRVFRPTARARTDCERSVRLLTRPWRRELQDRP